MFLMLCFTEFAIFWSMGELGIFLSRFTDHLTCIWRFVCDVIRASNSVFFMQHRTERIFSLVSIMRRRGNLFYSLKTRHSFIHFFFVFCCQTNSIYNSALHVASDFKEDTPESSAFPFVPFLDSSNGIPLDNVIYH